MTQVTPGLTPDFQQGAVADAQNADPTAGGAIDVPTGNPDPVVTPPPTPADPGRTFTEAEVERIRKEEKDKLYAQLKDEADKRKAAEKELREKTKAEEEERLRLEEEQRKAAEAEMDARALIESRTAQWEAQFAEEREARARLEATLAQERRYNELQELRGDLIERERENILPELIDLISGSTPEEMEQTVVSLRQRSTAILGNVNAATSQARQQMQGASVTSPPVGPLEQDSQYQQLSAQEIADMDINTYAQHRDRLRGAVSSSVREHGIYGNR